MSILQRHRTSSTFLAIYFLWWLFILLYFTRPAQEGPVCDFAFPAIIFITPIIGILYSITFIIKAIKSKEPDTTDYLFFLGMVMLPIVTGTVFLLRNVTV